MQLVHQSLMHQLHGLRQFTMRIFALKPRGLVSGVATGGLGGRVPPFVPRTDCGIHPDPMRSW